MGSELIYTALGAGGGTVIGGGLVGWLFKSYIGKVDRLIEKVIRLEETVKANETMKADIKDHEKRLNLLEPSMKRAWQEIDKSVPSKH